MNFYVEIMCILISIGVSITVTLLICTTMIDTYFKLREWLGYIVKYFLNLNQ